MNYPMAAEGLEDNREDAYKYMKAISAGQSNDELINTYLDNANKMLEWLRDKFQYEWVLAGTTYQDYYEMPGSAEKDARWLSLLMVKKLPVRVHGNISGLL